MRITVRELLSSIEPVRQLSDKSVSFACAIKLSQTLEVCEQLLQEIQTVEAQIREQLKEAEPAKLVEALNTFLDETKIIDLLPIKADELDGIKITAKSVSSLRWLVIA